jgi:ParB family chromosome partitioning protein
MKRKAEIKSAYKDEKVNALVYSVEINNIAANQSQPRKSFDTNEIAKLATSIKRYGLLQPISIREISDSYKNGAKYELVAGERRLRACKMLGMQYIPSIIVNTDPETSAELAIIENIIRKDLNMFEEANAYSFLTTQMGLSQEEIALKMSKSQSSIANKLRLLRLSEEEQDLILRSDLTERHARALLRLNSVDSRLKALNYIIINKLNVSESEKYISSMLNSPNCGDRHNDIKYTPDKICKDVYKFIARVQKASKNLIINRKSDDKFITITLTIKKDTV